MSKTIVLLPPRKNTDWAAQLKLISESLEVSQADLAHAYQVDRRDMGKAYHGVRKLPERCVPVHMLLLMDTGEPELEAEFRMLLGLMRRNGISDERVNAMAVELYALVCQRQREEYEACKRAASDNGDFESWLHGQTNY